MKNDIRKLPGKFLQFERNTAILLLDRYEMQLHTSCDYVMKNFEMRQTVRKLALPLFSFAPLSHMKLCSYSISLSYLAIPTEIR